MVIKDIERELERVGVADLGPCDSVVASEGEYLDVEVVSLADDNGLWFGAPEEALRRLKGLPDNAGWEAFWQAFGDR